VSGRSSDNLGRDAVVEFYATRCRIGCTKQEEPDLAAFLRSK